MAARYPVSFEIQNNAGNPREAAVEAAELVLGPFSRIPKLEFANVEIGSEAVQIVNLRNPTDTVQSVVVILPKDFSERGFSVNSEEFEIPPYGAGELKLLFKPLKELQCRDTIYVKDKYRNQKSQFQLTSRSIPVVKKVTRKRKTWNINKKPLVVPTVESNVKIESRPPEIPILRPAESSNKQTEETMNVTFPVVSVTGNINIPTEKDSTFHVDPVNESAVFDDSLEVMNTELEIRTRVQYTSKTDSFTFDSVELSKADKENVGSGKKRRVFDMNFSDIGFDNLTPDRTEVRSCLRSLENVSHNTSTPLVSASKMKFTETTTYTTVTSVKKELLSSKAYRVLGDSRSRVDEPSRHQREELGTIKLEPASPPYQRTVSSLASDGLLRREPPIKQEPVTPEEFSSQFQFETAVPVNEKEEPKTPVAYKAETRSDASSAFKVPASVCPKLESFTPIPQCESMRKLAIAFAISPPKETLNSRRELFTKTSNCSTPRDPKSVVKRETEESFQSKTFNVKASDLSTTKKTKSSSQSPKKSVRGTTLSPKSLVAFKKSIRVHVPTRNASRPNSAKSDCSTSSEHFVVVDLYRPDFKGPLYHLDIYGATTMTDPFARCAIHPLEFRERQGQQLIRWVNSVLTPPEEYAAYEAGVDVASLWKKSLTDKVPLPPSRESVSSKFHKNEMHLHNLRKTAHLIFKSSDVVETLYKVYSKIDVGYISVKDDLDLHNDQGARYHLVQMLMYYNPLWLRIGLEAIYGKDIPLQPRHTVIGLMHFIRNNLLTDKYIVEKNSYQNIQHLRMPKFKKEMNDFIVFKFFSLVFFLDIAKQKAIVPYDPCLFNKNSPVKESEGMINEFIKEFIKCVGHMKRNLASIGFAVSHKQTAIDEYDFAVKTHLDLRDGANLTRLMEIVLLKKYLVKKLRLPAISRLQKVHNVKLAFNALAEENVPIVDVVPSDVVDGHFEKTMSLLWQILHKFLKPRMEKGAIIIQKWWRKQSLKVEIYRRIQLKRNLRVENAAVTIQSIWRGYSLRKRYPEMKKHLQQYKDQQTLIRHNAARKIQRWYRASMAMKKPRQQYEITSAAVLTIQRHYRAMVDGRKQRTEFLLKKKSAVSIQRWYRATVAMRKQRQQYEITRTAVLTIQRHYRAMVDGRKQRTELLLMKKSAVSIQRWHRATVAMRKQRQQYEIIRTALLKIQRRYRALVEVKKQRAEFLLVKKSAVSIQRWYRATVEMRKQRRQYEITRTAVLTIQRRYRAMVEGRKQRAEYLEQEKARSTISSRVAVENLLVSEERRQAALNIWRWYWRCKAARITRINYLQLREKVVFIQRRFRMLLQARREDFRRSVDYRIVSVAERSLSIHRMEEVKAKFMLKTRAAIVIQRWYRSLLHKRQQRVFSIVKKLQVLSQEQAVIRIQRYYRAYRLRVTAVEGAPSSPKVSSPTLSTKFEQAIDCFLGISAKVKTSLNWIYVSFKNLDVVTKYSPVLCERLADPELTVVYSVIYNILDTESRSDAYQAIFGHGMNALLHLALYQTTYDAVWQNTLKYNGIDILVFLMGKFIEKKEDIFCRAATLIWIFSRTPEQIQENKANRINIRRLNFYSKKILAKHKNVHVKTYKPVLPSLKTDWGYSKSQDQKEFRSRLDAILGLNKTYKFI